MPIGMEITNDPANPCIKYVNNFRISDTCNVDDICTPFSYKLEGSIIPEIFHKTVKPIVHPVGFHYSYEKIRQDLFDDYFNFNICWRADEVSVMVLCPDGNCLNPKKDIYSSKSEPSITHSQLKDYEIKKIYTGEFTNFKAERYIFENNHVLVQYVLQNIDGDGQKIIVYYDENNNEITRYLDTDHANIHTVNLNNNCYEFYTKDYFQVDMEYKPIEEYMTRFFEFKRAIIGNIMIMDGYDVNLTPDMQTTGGFIIGDEECFINKCGGFIVPSGDPATRYIDENLYIELDPPPFWKNALVVDGFDQSWTLEDGFELIEELSKNYRLYANSMQISPIKAYKEIDTKPETGHYIKIEIDVQNNSLAADQWISIDMRNDIDTENNPRYIYGTKQDITMFTYIPTYNYVVITASENFEGYVNSISVRYR
jgi:hypothetical protein